MSPATAPTAARTRTSAPEITARLLPPEAGGGALRSLSAHLALWGPVPQLTPARLTAEVEASGLTGRGGAAFPVGRKLASVTAAGGGPPRGAHRAQGRPARAT